MGAIAPSANTLLAVNYNRATISSNLRLIAGREQAAGASFVQAYDFPHQNLATRVVSVPTAKVAQVEASLRTQAGFQSVGATGERRYRATTSALWTNDPYFDGFMAGQIAQTGTVAAPTYETLPYAESSNVPGQWDMHVIGLEHAFGYSQPGTTYTSNSGALGSSQIKIAIIDTGADANHPELNSKLPYQRCFITGNQTGSTPAPQSTGVFATDVLGHGTDVAGIAAGATNNSFGFASVGGNAVIYGYRVFPTPDDTCANENLSQNDPQCSSDTLDIAAAIVDAVAQHVNVISMSLGGGSCMNGIDSDVSERNAVNEAISANIIVVAASGNDNPTQTGVTAPACDNGVIAVGATSLDDGNPTGTTGNYTSSLAIGASSSSPVEYVASYSQFGSPGANVRSSNAWGIVAPGGDPANSETCTNCTANDLHWIENIWTSTPYQSSPSDNLFAGECTNDYPNGSSNTHPDCRTLIAGTSMATPHVAGAAALILSVAPQYQSPTLMKQLLCQTADDISDSHQGCGRLNIYNAMGVVMNDSARPTPIP